MDGTTSFRETQHLRQKWVYIILLLILSVFIYGITQQVVFGKPFGDKPAPDFILILVALFIASLIYLFYRTRLETIVNGEGISYRWFPFQKSFKLHSWNNISKVEIIKYGFVGYGWRITSHGVVHTLGGKEGLKIYLKSGGTFVLGTQKREELSSYLKEINKLNTN